METISTDSLAFLRSALLSLLDHAPDAPQDIRQEAQSAAEHINDIMGHV